MADAPLSRAGPGCGLVQLILSVGSLPPEVRTSSLTSQQLAGNQPTNQPKNEAALRVPSARPPHLAKDGQSATSAVSSGVKLEGQPAWILTLLWVVSLGDRTQGLCVLGRCFVSELHPQLSLHTSTS